MANNKRIEEVAINILKTALLKSPYLESYIDSNDKTPSWDGNVIVYTNEDGKKNNIMGRVPIQVKGTEVNPVKKDGTITYSADVADLNNYYNDGGAIFFVIFVHTPMISGEIYYKSLLPYDLNRIMESVKSKKTYAIQLKRFPDDSAIEMTNIFMRFLSNKPRQMSIIGKDLPSLKRLEDSGAMIESLSICTTVVGINPDSIGSYIASHDIYLYAKIKGTDIEIPVEKVTEASITKQIDAPVKVKDKVFYKVYQIVYKKDMSYIQIGKSLSIKMNKEMQEATFDIKMKGSLCNRIRDLEFIISMVENHEITINGATIKINSFENELIDELRKLFKYWDDVKRMLDVLGVKEDLDCDQLSDNDFKNIKNFVNTVLYNKEIGFPNVTENLYYGIFEISNLEILLWYEKQSSGNYKIQNYFNHRDIKFFENGNKNPIDISQFLLLRKLDFSHVSNLDCDKVVEDLKDRPVTSMSSEMMNFLALDIITGYDKQEKKDDTLLALADRIYDILEKNPAGADKDIIILNKLQIIKRRRDITTDEIVQLALLKEESKPLATRCGAYILLDEFDKAKECLNAMKSKDKEEFIKYPIYSLYAKKGV